MEGGGSARGVPTSGVGRGAGASIPGADAGESRRPEQGGRAAGNPRSADSGTRGAGAMTHQHQGVPRGSGCSVWAMTHAGVGRGSPRGSWRGGMEPRGPLPRPRCPLSWQAVHVCPQPHWLPAPGGAGAGVSPMPWPGRQQLRPRVHLSFRWRGSPQTAHALWVPVPKACCPALPPRLRQGPTVGQVLGGSKGCRDPLRPRLYSICRPDWGMQEAGWGTGHRTGSWGAEVISWRSLATEQCRYWWGHQ